MTCAVISGPPGAGTSHFARTLAGLGHRVVWADGQHCAENLHSACQEGGATILVEHFDAINDHTISRLLRECVDPNVAGADIYLVHAGASIPPSLRGFEILSPPVLNSSNIRDWLTQHRYFLTSAQVQNLLYWSDGRAGLAYELISEGALSTTLHRAPLCLPAASKARVLRSTRELNVASRFALIGTLIFGQCTQLEIRRLCESNEHLKNLFAQQFLRADQTMIRCSDPFAALVCLCTSSERDLHDLYDVLLDMRSRAEVIARWQAVAPATSPLPSKSLYAAAASQLRHEPWLASQCYAAQLNYSASPPSEVARDAIDLAISTPDIETATALDRRYPDAIGPHAFELIGQAYLRLSYTAMTPASTGWTRVVEALTMTQRGAVHEAHSHLEQVFDDPEWGDIGRVLSGGIRRSGGDVGPINRALPDVLPTWMPLALSVAMLLSISVGRDDVPPGMLSSIANDRGDSGFAAAICLIYFDLEAREFEQANMRIESLLQDPINTEDRWRGPLLTCVVGALEYLRGDSQRSDLRLSQPAGSLAFLDPALWGLAISVALSRLLIDDAPEQTTAYVAESFSSQVRSTQLASPDLVYALTQCYEALLRAGDHPKCSEIRAWLNEVAAAFSAPHAWAALVTLDLLDLTLGDNHQCVVPTISTIQDLDTSGNRPALAYAWYWYGNFQSNRGDIDQALQAWRISIGRFEAIGDSQWQRHVQRAVDGQSQHQRHSTPWGFTPTERRIASLVMTGASNAAIADELDRSQRTIETHLANIYHKAKVGSRRELRAALDQVRFDV